MAAIACPSDELAAVNAAPAARPAGRWWLVPALFGFWAILFFHGLSVGELRRTEGLRARIAQEMLQSHSWVVPTLYGEPIFTKPPLQYWTVVLLSLPGGAVTEWSARLPSALGAMAAVLLFAWYFHRQLGVVGGIAAAVGLPMSFLWLDKASVAEMDMLHVACVTASIVLVLQALEAEEEQRGPWAWWLASFLSLACGILTKWTAPVFFYGMLVPLLWRRGQLRLLICRRHLACAGLAAAVCLTWVIAAASSVGWRAFLEAVGQEAWGKVALSHHRHAYPIRETLVYPAFLLAAGLPWSALSLRTLWPGFARGMGPTEKRLLDAMHCWVWPSVLFWSLVPEHSPRHAFGLFPGLAGLGVVACVVWTKGGKSGRVRTLCRSLAGAAGVWLVVKLTFVHAIIQRHEYDPLSVAYGRPIASARLAGHRLRAAVPAGQVLYVVGVKDEGITFYYGGEVRRLTTLAEVPHADSETFCLVTEAVYQKAGNAGQTVLRLTDAQAQPIRLIAVREGHRGAT